MSKKKSKKMGRPEVVNPANAKLGPIRVRPDQLEAYKQAAKKSGKTFSAWVRDCLDKEVK